MYSNIYAVTNLSTWIRYILVAVGVAEGTCTRGAIRYDPAHNNTVVQICIANRWGYICAAYSDAQERVADVACQQMGYSKYSNNGITAKTITSAHHTPHFIQWLDCSDKPIIQQNILDCSHQLYEPNYHSNHQCGSYAAASNCTNTSVCQNGQIQLLDTNAVLLCVNGEWHALCSTTWSSTQAQVVCRQLGKNTIGAMPVSVSVPANISVLQANFECHGNEKFLFNCSDSDNQYICSTFTEAFFGVMCEDFPGPPSNLTVNSQQSDIILHWEYTDDANNVSNFRVYCKHNVTVDPQLHLNIKTELSLLTKNNNATLIGLLANTVYTCCVSAVFPYMETESTCINVTKATATVASSSSNGAISWIGGIFIEEVKTNNLSPTKGHHYKVIM
ncbi:PREDICTED: scavenger receptor cysteine-rich domain superfamily protein-like [Amphimedon queenslandica]|uniref:SRCR domain-containing protein n=1 Tax=Amphimedon queenslandica TaxID=400682 RepID=A0AAN0JDA9_AMPQE|nr:PREDICTED: scavenger receptor cysteine-rich domain superfamily protein-like [Amphimedon queenslandica]|eukprot:XP_019854727.1 PREDICTED: scavenger receptor cysteine-rich domain superfamily protein-like [Amphimedon queenslandica]